MDQAWLRSEEIGVIRKWTITPISVPVKLFLVVRIRGTSECYSEIGERESSARECIRAAIATHRCPYVI